MQRLYRFIKKGKGIEPTFRTSISSINKLIGLVDGVAEV
jgi:hypothetical protein